LGNLKVGGCTKLFPEVGFKFFKTANSDRGHRRGGLRDKEFEIRKK
jgi:hypothetical protein